MSSPFKRTNEQISNALVKYKGNISAAAMSLGINRLTVRRAIQRNEELQAVLHNSRETMIDMAESALNKAVMNGEGWAVCFFLKCQARRRGYGSAGSMVHPILAEVRQAEADVLTSLGQLMLTPRSRSASRLTADDIQQEITVDNEMSATLLKMMP